MRALQLTLHRSWDRLENSFLVSWSDDCLQDLRWWMDPERLLWGVSISTLTRPRLLIRRVRRRLGCSPRSQSRFRPLVSGRGFSFHKREGAVSRGEGSPPLSLLRQPFHGRSVCRQLHSRGLSSQRRGHSFSGSQFYSPAYPPMVGTPPCSPSSPVHHGKSQCSGRLSLSPEPDPGVGVDSPQGSLSGAPLPVASNGRPICYLSKSPLLHLFLALPRSSGDGDGCSAIVLGSPPGLRVPSLGFDSTGPPQASIVIRNCVDSDRPVLASKALVSGSAGPSNRPAGNVASSTRSPQPASLSASSSRAPQASSSCLATLQRFARAVGFSSRVAAQVGLARRSSSRTSYQLK